MRCSACGTGNPDEARFCLNCGARLALTCPQCGTELPSQARFCTACGAQVAASPPDPLAEAVKRLAPREYAERLVTTRGQVAQERRLVTILFSDVKGSTALAENLDPEDVLDIINGAFEFLIAPIYRYEGTVARLMGDAILAFFGAPIAHEDDPERACRAGLDILQGARDYAAQLERERGMTGFSVRVGINTGLVVVGEVGSDLRVEYTAVGDAVNLASRMESAAEPGTILISQDTHRLVAPLFDTQPVGPVQVKGRIEPVATYRVLAVREAPGKVRGIEGLESPLVGRDGELAALQQALERLRAGVGGIITIGGEAGIGKSRLVAEARRGVDPARLQWVESRCPSYGTAVAYRLWLDALRGLLSVREAAVTARSTPTLREQVRVLCPEYAKDIYPYVARVMSLPLTPEEETAVQELEGTSSKAATFDALVTLLEGAAAQRPLALVCEDLQWADPTSIEVLEHLLALTDRVALLLICVFRPDRQHGSWHIRETAARLYPHRHTEVWLQPLSMADSESLLGNLLLEEALPRSLKLRILHMAEGNPFYAEEIVRSLIDSGAIVQDEPSGYWRPAPGLREIAIPDTLRGVLAARVDRLPEAAKRVLQTAAVIGRVFPYRLLAAISDVEPELTGHLLTLQREQMIRERARLPEIEYIFKHHLTQEAAYAGLLRKERRLLHRRVAEALEAAFSERIEENIEVLAHHWHQAAEPAKATPYLLQAGDRACALGASLEAIDFYQLALQQAAGLDSSARAAHSRRAHEGLGDVYLVNLSRLDEALKDYESFLELAETVEAKARGARKVGTVHLLQGNLPAARRHYEDALELLAPLPSMPETSRVHYGISYLLLASSQLDEAEQEAGITLEISRQVDDTRGMADAYRVLGIIASLRGDLEAARLHGEHSLELYRSTGDLPRMAMVCNNVGDVCRLLGELDRAQERLSEGLDIAQRIGDTRDEALLLQTIGELYLDQGQWQAATESLERALPIAEQSGVANRIIEVHRVLAAACEGTGRLEAGRRHLETAEELMRSTEQFRYAPTIYLGLAQLSATRAEFDEAWRYLGRAVEAAEQGPSNAFLGVMHRCRAHVHSCQGSWDPAISELEHSSNLLEQASLPAELGRTRLLLGSALQSRDAAGDRERAREELLAALAIFRRIGARGFLAEVQARLGELGCSPQHPDPLPGEDA